MTDPTDPLETAETRAIYTAPLRALPSGFAGVHQAADYIDHLASELARVRAELTEAKADHRDAVAELRNCEDLLSHERDSRDRDTEKLRSLIATIDRDNGERQEGETVAQSCERAGKVVAAFDAADTGIRGLCAQLSDERDRQSGIAAGFRMEAMRWRAHYEHEQGLRAIDTAAIRLALGNPSATVEEMVKAIGVVRDGAALSHQLMHNILVAYGNEDASNAEICARLRRMAEVEEALVFLCANRHVLDCAKDWIGIRRLNLEFQHDGTGPSAIGALVRATNVATK